MPKKKYIEEFLPKDREVGSCETPGPSRKVVTRSPHRSVGIIACSWIQDEAIEYESQLERRFLQRALLFPYLKKVLHQPFTIPFPDKGTRDSYTPDFLLIFKDESKIVIEIKPSIFVAKYSEKFAAANAFLDKHNYPFYVITDKHIDVENYAYNAALLLRYARGSISELNRRNCLEAFKTLDVEMSIGQLIERASVSFEDILYLAGRGILSIPLEIKISYDTLITPSMKGDKNDHICFLNWFNATPRYSNTDISNDA